MSLISGPPEAASENASLAVALCGIPAVTIEHAVAAPYATSRLAEAGARAIKIERPPAGDFARHYGAAVHGERAHFVRLNQGKESAVLDFKQPADMQVLRTILRRAQVAYGLIRSVEDLLRHPALSMNEVDTPTGPVRLPRRAVPRTSLTERNRVPALGAQTAKIRGEFAPGASSSDSLSITPPA